MKTDHSPPPPQNNNNQSRRQRLFSFSFLSRRKTKTFTPATAEEFNKTLQKTDKDHKTKPTQASASSSTNEMKDTVVIAPALIELMMNSIMLDYQFHFAAYKKAKSLEDTDKLRYHTMRLSLLDKWSKPEGYPMFLQAIHETQEMFRKQLSFTETMTRSKNNEELLVFWGTQYRSSSSSESFYGLCQLSKIISFEVSDEKEDLTEFVNLCTQYIDFFVKPNSPDYINISSALRKKLLEDGEDLTDVDKCKEFINLAGLAYIELVNLVKPRLRELNDSLKEPTPSKPPSPSSASETQTTSPTVSMSASSAPVVSSGDTKSGYSLRPRRSQSTYSIPSSSSDNSISTSSGSGLSDRERQFSAGSLFS